MKKEGGAYFGPPSGPAESPLGPLLGRSSGALGAVLGPPWAALGAVLGHLGANLRLQEPIGSEKARKGKTFGRS